MTRTKHRGERYGIFREDFSFEQITAMIGSSAGAIKMKYYRNRKILINRLSDAFKEG